MKRHLLFLIVVTPLLSLEVYAQGGDPTLGGNKPAVKDSKSSPSAPSPHTLAFGVEKKGRLDPKTSAKNASGSLYEEMIFRAGSEDSLSFIVKSNDPSLNTSLGLQIFGRNNAEVAVAKASPGEFKIATPTGGLPANGDYRVRVTCPMNGKGAIPFTIKIDRLGLTSTAYNERFSKIYEKYNEKDQASIDETADKLEKLAKDAPNFPTAFERLGIIYLENRNDIGKAEWAFAQAIKTGGVARFAISYDGKWRQMTKLRSGDTGFEDKRTGWLRIKSGMLTLHDARDTVLATITGKQIQELSKPMAIKYSMVQITTNMRKTYIIAPERMLQVDADLVVRLIQNHVNEMADK
ncbi:MAG: hypothetical protein J2P21_03210 [Chloracidobacterium sp.]|nr:hypothetical protein [Chloracidobacterium sp.]